MFRRTINPFKSARYLAAAAAATVALALTKAAVKLSGRPDLLSFGPKQVRGYGFHNVCPDPGSVTGAGRGANRRRWKLMNKLARHRNLPGVSWKSFCSLPTS